MFLPRGKDWFHPAPISEASWAKLIAANDGKLSKEIAEWEKWDQLEGGVCRFFWKGNPQTLDTIQTFFEKGDSLLIEYERSLAWLRNWNGSCQG